MDSARPRDLVLLYNVLVRCALGVTAAWALVAYLFIGKYAPCGYTDYNSIVQTDERIRHVSHSLPESEYASNVRHRLGSIVLIRPIRGARYLSPYAKTLLPPVWARTMPHGTIVNQELRAAQLNQIQRTGEALYLLNQNFRV